MTKLGFVIVNYNDYPMTKRLLENIKDYKCLSEIFLKLTIKSAQRMLQMLERPKSRILEAGR